MAHFHNSLPSPTTSSNLLDLALKVESYLIVEVQIYEFCSLRKSCNITIPSQSEHLVTRGHK